MEEISDVTTRNIELIDSVLDSIGAPPLFENPNFEIDPDSLGYYRVIVKMVSSRLTVPLIILLEGDSIRLDVFNLNEAFEWSSKMILNSRQEVVDFFRKLFTSYIMIESGLNPNSKSRMYLFDKQGALTDKYLLRGFMNPYTGWNCDKALYFPLY